jgi:hypothetical protein
LGFNLILGNAGTDMLKGGTDKTDRSPSQFPVLRYTSGN